MIIPSLGGLSGGYVALDRAGVWRRPRVYADTAVAALPEIKDFIRRFGTDRLLFGSDSPRHPRGRVGQNPRPQPA